MDYAAVGKGLAAEAIKHLPKWMLKLRLPLVSIGMLVFMAVVSSNKLHEWYLYLLLIPYSFLLNDFVALIAVGNIVSFMLKNRVADAPSVGDSFTLAMNMVRLVLPFFVGCTLLVNSTILLACNVLLPSPFLWIFIGLWLNILGPILYFRLLAKYGLKILGFIFGQKRQSAQQQSKS